MRRLVTAWSCLRGRPTMYRCDLEIDGNQVRLLNTGKRTVVENIFRRKEAS